MANKEVSIGAPPIDRKKPPEHHGQSKKALIARIAGSLLALTGIGISGGSAAQHHFENQEQLSPAGIVEDIKGIPPTIGKDWNSILERLGLKSTVEATIPISQTLETFDPKSLDTYIGPKDTVHMTLDEAIKAAPPVWQAESKTLTAILPIMFKDNRTAELHIVKTPEMYVGNKTPYVMIIDGLQAGDVIVAPMDGIIETDGGNGQGVVRAFFLHGKGPNGERLDMIFATTDLNLLIYPTPPPQNVKISTPIKMGDPIGTLLTSDRHPKFTGQIRIDGIGPLNESFDLAATSDGKAIVLK